MMKEAYFNTHNKSTNVRVGRVRQSIIHAVFGFLWRWVPGLTRWINLKLTLHEQHRLGEEQ